MKSLIIDNNNVKVNSSSLLDYAIKVKRIFSSHISTAAHNRCARTFRKATPNEVLYFWKEISPLNRLKLTVRVL